MTAAATGPFLRRWSARGLVVADRAVARLGKTAGHAARIARGKLGRTVLPTGALLPAGDGRVPCRADDEALPAALLPLPAPRRALRALAGPVRPSLDAWAPWGPQPSDAPAVVLLPVHQAVNGTWDLAAAAVLARERAAAHPETLPPHTVLLCSRAQRGEALRLLRAGSLRDPRGVQLLSADPVKGGAAPPALLADALRLVDAVLVPQGAAPPQSAIHTAHAAGRPVLEGPTAPPLPEVVSLGRAARLDLARELGGTNLGRTADAPTPTVEEVRETRRVVVAGHDLKFAGEVIEALQAEGHEVRIDPWAGHARHDHERSRALADWADVVHCEWSLGNLAWYSRRLPHHTRLTTRTHLQEASTSFPARTRVDRVDAWAFVASHVRDQVLGDLTDRPRSVQVVPNGVADPGQDVRDASLRRPELRFTLGLVGVLPERKGLHTALDVLAALRAEDPRFRLRIRGHHPEEQAWVASRPAAREYYATQHARIADDPLLQGAVQWDPHGPDMTAWYSEVGTVLSTSAFESFHFTLPDGAAHGCLPRSLAWAGADRLYPTSWLAPDAKGLAAAIGAGVGDADTWAAGVDAAARHVRQCFGPERTTRRLADLVVGARA